MTKPKASSQITISDGDSTTTVIISKPMIRHIKALDAYEAQQWKRELEETLPYDNYIEPVNIVDMMRQVIDDDSTEFEEKEPISKNQAFNRHTNITTDTVELPLEALTDLQQQVSNYLKRKMSIKAIAKKMGKSDSSIADIKSAIKHKGRL